MAEKSCLFLYAKIFLIGTWAGPLNAIAIIDYSLAIAMAISSSAGCIAVTLTLFLINR